ncbi:ribonuclease 3-like protein 2 [Euphorbia lathyris]|uniref:ribonuclease 3-like protein 2 n=1 Tax=Euphorbia lathyris TaxID=212925 RepID=UPI003313B83D
MEVSFFAIERLLNYTFKNKRLLHEALTHPTSDGSSSYQRLEFIGDAALGLALTNHIFLVYPHLDPHWLTLLRAANLSNEKLARVAALNHLYQFFRHNLDYLDDLVREFTDAVRQENTSVAHRGSIKAPKVLADLLESLAGAVYLDLNFDLQSFWVVFRHLLEPIVTLEELEKNLPVSMLYELCEKKGKEIDIVNCKKETEDVASVCVDGAFVVSSSCQQKEIPKLNAADEALPISHMMESDVIDEQLHIQNPKQKLDSLCVNKKWPKPSYSIQELGPPHERKYVCSVQIETRECVLYKVGEEETKVKAAKSSAASVILQALQQSK